MKFQKRLLSGILIASLSLSMAACGSSGGGSTGDKKEDGAIKDQVYRETVVPMKDTGVLANDISTLSYSKGRIYFFATHYDYDQKSGMASDAENVIVHMKEDGTDVKKVELPKAPKGYEYYYPATAFDQEGNAYLVIDKTPAYEDVKEDPHTSDAGDSGDASGKANVVQDEYSLVKLDPSGKQLFSVKLGEKALKDPNIGTYYTNSLLYLEGKGLLLSDLTGNYILSDQDGSLKSTISQSKEGNNSDQLMVDKEGRLYRYDTSDASTETLSRLNMETWKEEGEPLKLTKEMPELSYAALVPGTGTDYDFVTMGSGNETDLYGWNFGDKTAHKICDFVSSNLMTQTVDSLISLGDGKFLIRYESTEQSASSGENGEGDPSVISLLTKVDPKDVKDKKELIMAYNDWMSANLRAAVINFNKKNDQYRIRLKSYTTEYNENTGVGSSPLNNDIISGNTPDLVVMDANMPKESYYAKGIFEPLDSRFEKEGFLDKTKYYTNVFDAYRSRGKIYEVIPFFSINTLAVKKKYADKMKPWTIQTMQQMADGMHVSYDKLFGFSVPRDSLFQMLLMFNADRFIDWEKQKADFQNEDFYQLLEVSKKFPKDTKNEDYDPDQENWYYQDKSLLYPLYLAAADSYQYARYGAFREPIAIVGYPSADGKGASSISEQISLAMSATTTSKDACWDFLSSLLKDDFQKQGGYTLPVLRSELDKGLQKAMKPNKGDQDAKGGDVMYSNGGSHGVDTTGMKPLTQEDVDQIKGLIESVHQKEGIDPAVMDILLTETSAYFAGQKSAQDVAKVIQSKVQTYMEENS